MKLSSLLHPDYQFYRPGYWFGAVDGRSLAMFRIAFALLLLKDAIYHLPLARLFYSDEGILPRQTLLALARDNRFSLMDAFATGWMATGFFMVWIGVLLCLLVGYRTRWATIINFLLILSVHERNIYLLNGADNVMRVLSFWMMFLPVGCAFSLDAMAAIRKPSEGSEDRGPVPVFAFPLRMAQIQVALIYVFALLLKLPGGSWVEGTAMHYALQIEPLTLMPARWLMVASPAWLLSVLGWSALIFEGAFVFLVFSPVLQPELRQIGLAIGCLFHMGIAVMFAIPNFSWVMLISYLLFVDWSWIETPLSDLAGRIAQPPIVQTVDAWFRQRLPAIHKLSPVGAPATGWKAAGVAAQTILMLLVIWWNIATFKPEGTPLLSPLEGAPHTLIQTTGLWQEWGMFAPYPTRRSGWLNVTGRFEDGTTLDLRTERPPNGEAIRWVWGPTARWRKFEEQVARHRSEALLRSWARYYCQEHNAVRNLSLGRRLATLEIRYIYYVTGEPGQPPGPRQDELLWKHWCFPEYAY